MDLHTLTNIERLSVRTFNVCNDNGLNSLEDILTFYMNNKTFKGLRNCGTKSDAELRKICNKYRNRVLTTQTVDVQSHLINNYKRVISNELKRSQFIIDAEILISKLSVRAANALHNMFCGKQYSLFGFVDLAILNQFDFKSIRNVGKTTVPELVRLKHNLIDVINSLADTEFSEMDMLVAEITRVLELNGEDSFLLKESIKNDEVNLIQFFDYFVLNSSYCEPKRVNVLKYLIEFDNSESRTSKLNEIARQNKLTRERARQLSVKLDKEFRKKYYFVRLLFKHSYRLDKLTLEQDYWKITAQPINSSINHCELINHEITLSNLLRYFGDNDFYVLSGQTKLEGRQSTYDKGAYKEFQFLKVNYTVSMNFFKKDSLMGILNDLFQFRIDRIQKNCLFDLSTYNLSFEQMEFLKIIIHLQFNLEVQDKSVFFKRNTLVTASEIINEILVSYDDLMTAEEIQIEYNKRVPERKKPLNSIRSALNGEGFIYLRGSGVSRYGLKSWENERNLRAGSIKEMCYDYVKGTYYPVHMHELAQYVLKHRKTKLKNIVNNLKMDARNRFVFFKGGFIGVKEKKYPQDYIDGLKSPGPYDANNICSFVKNHRFYSIEKLVVKFSNETGLHHIQIRYIIDTKIEEGILRAKNDRIYYDMIEEDSLIDLVFRNSDYSSFFGFNPYRMTFDSYRLLCKVNLISNLELRIDESMLEFSKYDLDNSEIRSVVYYQMNLRLFIAIVWTDDDNVSNFIGNSLEFRQSSKVIIDKIDEGLFVLYFPMEKVNSFPMAIQNIFNKVNFDEEDLSIYQIEGLSKLEAFSLITEISEKLLGKSIGLVEAKKIYNRLKLYE